MRGWIMLALLTVAGCNGKAATDGSCFLSGVANGVMEWSCTSSATDASRFLTACSLSAQNVAGASCMIDTTTGTTNPTAPAHTVVPAPECIECPSGNGTDWVCGSQGWEVAGVYTCRQ